MSSFYKVLLWVSILLTGTILIGCRQFQFLQGKSSDNPEKEIILFDGESLEGWKITSWKYRGEVKVEDQMLKLGKGHECTGVTWQRDFPNVNYEVTLDAKRVEGSDFFCGMTFPVKDEFCSLIVGGWGGTLVGLSSIDGFDASENSTSTIRNFENDRWYHIRLRVTEQDIKAWIDEEKVVDFNTENHRLSVRMEVMWSRPFGICTWRTAGALRDVRVRYPVKDEK